MIVALGKGRAGNLMFQLAGIDSQIAHGRERVVLFGFADLEHIFPELGHSVSLRKIPSLIRRHFRWIDSFFRRLARAGLIGSISQTREGDPRLNRKDGLIPITYFWGGFCQSERAISTRLLESLYASESESMQARSEWPMSSKAESRSPAQCFVHVRRGDYLQFPTLEASAALPGNWYLEQMSMVRKAIPSVSFTVVSDDIDWCAETFAELQDTKILSSTAKEAFFLMTHCDAGILSPSTFSWWAAFFASRVSVGPFIAPRYWTGWRTGTWDPHPEIETSFITYREVTGAR